MPRAGAVSHPDAWRESSYHEIQDERVRRRIVDNALPASLLGCPDLEALRELHQRMVDPAP